jgi:hypothetical protein
MKKIILVATCIGALSAFATPGASAQGTGRPPTRIAKKSASQGIGKGKRVSFADDLKAKVRALKGFE